MELENIPCEEVHTRSGKDFAKDYSKNPMERPSRPLIDEEATAPQKESFCYDIVDHLSHVPAKVSLLNLIRMDKNIRSLSETQFQQGEHGSRLANVDCFATHL